jgi:hypothetical protein
MPAFKQTVCKFWLAGTCGKGRSCTWAHGDEDGNGSFSNGTSALVFKRPVPVHSLPLIFPAQQFGVKRTLCKFFLQGTCDKGDACTWAHGDKELGVPIAEAVVEESTEDAFDSSLAELLQAAEEEEQAANETQLQAETEDRPVKRTLCKFFQEGNCRNGDNCSWAHGQEELELPLTEMEPEVLTPPPLLVFPGHEPAGPNEKRTICKFWKAGNCSRGDECTWAHGAQDLGAAAFVEPEVRKPLTIVLPRHEPAGPNEKRTICKYWQAGHCALGDECTWAHGAHDLGAPTYIVPDEAPLIAWAGPNAKRTLCKYWQAGNCALGNECTYAHGAKDLAASSFVQPELLKPSPLIVLPKHEPAGPNEKRRICKFWQAGQCARGYECTFAHGEQDLAVSSHVVPEELPTHFFAGPNEKQTICKFWQAGHCANGDECTWAHGMRDLAVAPILPVKPPVVSSTGKIILPRKIILPNAPSTPSSPWRDQGKAGKGSVSPASASSTAAAPKFRSTAATETTRTVCKFWIQGSCARGRECTFSHGEEDIAPVIKPIVKPPAWTDKGSSWAPSTPEVEQPVRRTICKFWQQGSCQQEPGHCTWAHGEWEIGTLVGSRSQSKGRGKTYEDVGPAFKRQRYY